MSFYTATLARSRIRQALPDWVAVPRRPVIGDWPDADVELFLDDITAFWRDCDEHGVCTNDTVCGEDVPGERYFRALLSEHRLGEFLQVHGTPHSALVALADPSIAAPQMLQDMAIEWSLCDERTMLAARRRLRLLGEHPW